MVTRKPAKRAKRGQSAAAKRTKSPPRTEASEASGSPRAVRLTFSYDGPAVTLRSQERVEMIVPPSDPMTGLGKQKGFWAELRDKDNKTLYRQVIHNPTRNDAEVFPDPDEHPEQNVKRAPAPKRKGTFVVLVPDRADGDSVTMCRSPMETTGAARGVRSLAAKPAKKFRRFKLKK